MSNWFTRSGRGSVRNYHSYITDDPVLQNIGLSSYSRNSIEKFGIERTKQGSKEISKEIKEYFGGSIPTEALLGESAELAIRAYDTVAKDYYIKSSTGEGVSNLWYTPSGQAAANLKDFQEKFDKVQKGFTSSLSPEQLYMINVILAEIQTSETGCITFNANYSVLGCSRSSLIRLYFETGGSTNSSRNVAFNGSSFIISDVGRTPAGTVHGREDTKQAGVGNYVGASEGGANNPKNTYSGPPRKSWNDSLGMWEFGTQQMLVRLISDIDGVPLKDLPPNVDNAQYYTGDLYYGECKQGSGVPFSVENGNPNLFGPNIVGCPSKPKVEKVIVTNRTPRSYSKGEIVLCSLIGTDWIPVGFGPPKVVNKKFESRLSDIQKYIVQTNAFFRDQFDGKNVNIGSNPVVNYGQSARFKFYDSLWQEPYNKTVLALLTPASGSNDMQAIAALNIKGPGAAKIVDGIVTIDKDYKTTNDFNININFVPSTGYITVYDADVIPETLGGNNTFNTMDGSNSILLKTNYSQTTYDEPEFNEHFAANSRNSWGIYFPDGYTAASVSRVKNYVEKANPAKPSALIYKEGIINFGSNAQILPVDAEGGNGTSFDVFDSNLFHLPAQIGLSGSGNPTLDYSANLWRITHSSDGKANYSTQIWSYLDFPPRYKGDWLIASGGKDLFNLSPVNPNKLQFSALSMNLALSNLIISSNSDDYGKFRDLRNTLYSPFSKNRHLILGNCLVRNKIDNIEKYTLYEEGGIKLQGSIGFGDYLIDYHNNKIVPPNRKDAPDDGPGIFPDSASNNNKEASNVIGILAAKSTVSLPDGGQLTLTTNNHFGYNGYGRAIGGGSNPLVTILGGMTWSSDTGGISKQLENVQYGSSDDGENTVGSVGLWAKIYDHCPNTIYDGRYFTPLHFNSSGNKLDFLEPSGKPGDIIEHSKYMPSAGNPNPPKLGFGKNPIRRNMMLTGGGFYYLKKYLSAFPGSTIKINRPGGGYSPGDEITFAGGAVKFILENTGPNGEIIRDGLKLVSSGNFTSNPFEGTGARPSGLKGTLSRTQEVEEFNAQVYLQSLKICQSVEHDPEPHLYKQTRLSKPDNNGNGDGDGYVRTTLTTNVALSNNTNTNNDIGNGKYDIFYFFANDIICLAENGNGGTYLPFDPYVQYINLEINAG